MYPYARSAASGSARAPYPFALRPAAFALTIPRRRPLAPLTGGKVDTRVKQTQLDPVTLEVIRNALPAISTEMAVDLQRTSYNMIIYEVRDFCTALVNPEGELVSQNMGGVSHFVADLGVLIVDGMKRYGRAGFKPGDVIITPRSAMKCDTPPTFCDTRSPLGRTSAVQKSRTS